MKATNLKLPENVKSISEYIVNVSFFLNRPTIIKIVRIFQEYYKINAIYIYRLLLPTTTTTLLLLLWLLPRLLLLCLNYNPWCFTDPYIKLALLQKGRTMEKHAGHAQTNKPSPLFNEHFFFDLPSNELSKVTLLLSVYHKETSTPAATVPATTTTSSDVTGDMVEPSQNRHSDPVNGGATAGATVAPLKQRPRRSLSLSSNGSDKADYGRIFDMLLCFVS